MCGGCCVQEEARTRWRMSASRDLRRVSGARDSLGSRGSAEGQERDDSLSFESARGWSAGHGSSAHFSAPASPSGALGPIPPPTLGGSALTSPDFATSGRLGDRPLSGPHPAVHPERAPGTSQRSGGHEHGFEARGALAQEGADGGEEGDRALGPQDQAEPAVDYRQTMEEAGVGAAPAPDFLQYHELEDLLEVGVPSVYCT